MRMMTIALGLLAFAAAASAQNNVETSRQPFSGAITNPCNGEPLVYEGSCHYVTRTAGTTTDVHAVCAANGVGFFGNEYMFGLTSMQRIETLACGSNQQFTERTRLITSRALPNAFITVTFRLVTDATCTPHVVVDETEAECRGRTGVF